jgi:mannose-6-phosphate isomerase-like protein (cupin superfamily)
MQHVTTPAPVEALKAAPEGVEQLVRVERPWGWYENLSWVPGYKVKRIRVHPGQQLSLQKHSQRDEHWVVVLGAAFVTVGDQVFILAVGGHVDIACGQVHRLANQTEGPVEIIELQFGAYLGEDDIVRLGDDYGRT